MKYERQNDILKILKEKKACSVAELCEQIFASPATIRRDITDLVNKGLVRSFYGGVSLIEKNTEALFEERKIIYEEEKRCIAYLALEQINDDMFIALDSSTTCVTLGRLLGNLNNLKILTNGLETLSALHKILRTPLYSTGGRLNAHTTSMLGNAAHEQIQNYYTDIFFCSCRGLSFYGSSQVSEEEAQIKKHFHSRSMKTILLCDDSKFGQIYPHIALRFSQIDMIISNAPFPEILKNHILSENPKIILNSPSKSLEKPDHSST